MRHDRGWLAEIFLLDPNLTISRDVKWITSGFTGATATRDERARLLHSLILFVRANVDISISDEIAVMHSSSQSVRNQAPTSETLVIRAHFRCSAHLSVLAHALLAIAVERLEKSTKW